METAGASVDAAHHLVALCWLYVINVLWFEDAAVSPMHHLKCLRAPCWTLRILVDFPKTVLHLEVVHSRVTGNLCELVLIGSSERQKEKGIKTLYLLSNGKSVFGDSQPEVDRDSATVCLTLNRLSVGIFTG